MTKQEAQREAQALANQNGGAVYVCTGRYSDRYQDFWTVCASDAKWMMGNDADVVCIVRPEPARAQA